MKQRLNLISLEDLYQSLIELRDHLALTGAPRARQDLRGNELKLPRQSYHAALFARAWQGAHKIEKISVGFPEEQDCEYDAYLHWVDGSADRLVFVQLKELPPEELGPNETLNGIIAKSTAKYRRSPTLVLAVFVNRFGHYDTAIFPKHELGGLFVYGFCTPDSRLLFLAGEIGNRGWRATIPVEIYRKPSPEPEDLGRNSLNS